MLDESSQIFVDALCLTADQAMCMRGNGTAMNDMVVALCTGMTGESATPASGLRESSTDKGSTCGLYKAQIMHRY